VPSKVLITVEKALASEIGFIYEKHESIFNQTNDRDYLILLLFLIYEHQKEDKSFWYPYFNAINPGELSCYWTEQKKGWIDDKEMREELKA
jgi:hypothetical protein